MAEPYSPGSLLGAVSKKQYVVRERGIEILVKPIPDDDRPGAMDKRLLKVTLPIVSGFRGLLVSLFYPLALRSRNPKKLAAFMRRFFKSKQSLPLAHDVEVRHAIVNSDKRQVPIRIYSVRGEGAPGEGAPGGGLLPVFYYLHGGGFAAGRPDTVEEMVKLVVSLSGCVAVQAQYALAPENPFPASLEDCWEVLKWIYANAVSFGGDKNRICIAGDSAGGNLATVCAMRDRDEKTGMVKAQVLLYPVVNMAGREDDNYHFSLDQFTILKDHRKAILFRITAMRCAGQGLLGCVLGVKDESVPWLSPYLGNLAGMPPALILCGEFDCLRLDGEAYARKLQAAGCEVRVVRYLGLGHAFAEWIGVQPQAEDCMAEVARFLKDFVW